MRKGRLEGEKGGGGGGAITVVNTGLLCFKLC